MTYYKVLKPDGSCFWGGTGKWHLPQDGLGKWMPEITGDLQECAVGYHILTRDQLVLWLGPTIFEVEPLGEVIQSSDKCLARKARLVRIIESWNEKTERLFAADCAEHVLHLFESRHPKDDRPRLAIRAARDFVEGKISQEELAAAWAAAWDAAWDAARDAAWDAARDAAWAAARDAARDAAWDAAWAAAWDAARAAARDAARDAERKWQTERLFFYLDDK